MRLETRRASQFPSAATCTAAPFKKSLGAVTHALIACSLAFSMPASAETLRLKDGTVLKGEVVSRTDSTVVIRSDALGELRVPASALKHVAMGPADRSAMQEEGAAAFPDSSAASPASGTEPGAHPSARSADPSDHALFFLPTAFTPPKNSFLFRDFELLFLTFGFAPTASTTITGGFLFPIASEVQFLTAGFKQQLWMDPEKGAAVALTGNISNPVGEVMEDVGFLVNTNVVAGYRAPNTILGTSDGFGIHAAVGYLGSEHTDEKYDGSTGQYVKSSEWEGQYTFGMGAEFRLTRNAKFILEYLNTAPFGDIDSDLDAGILTMGFRLHGSRLSADISGLRPIVDEDMEGFIFWPLLVVSYRI